MVTCKNTTLLGEEIMEHTYDLYHTKKTSYVNNKHCYPANFKSKDLEIHASEDQ